MEAELRGVFASGAPLLVLFEAMVATFKAVFSRDTWAFKPDLIITPSMAEEITLVIRTCINSDRASCMRAADLSLEALKLVLDAFYGYPGVLISTTKTKVIRVRVDGSCGETLAEIVTTWKRPPEEGKTESTE